MRLRHPFAGSDNPRHRPGRTVRSRLTLVYGGLSLVSGAAVLVITGLLWGGTTGGPITVSARVPSQILAIGKERAPGKMLPPAPNQIHQVIRQLRGVAVEQHSSDLHQLLLYSGIALATMAIISLVLGWLVAGRVLRPLRTITSTARDISATNLHERLDLTGPDDELKELGNTFDQLLERLERSFESQRQFAANASHELRTPLATMRASLDVALAKPEPVSAQMATLADRLHAELDHVDRLLESFLALARAQRRPAADEVSIPLDLLAASALEERAGAIASMNLDVRTEPCPGARVTGNETLLARLVGNVIDNAVRHNERGGWIRVRAEVEGDSARLTVENGGPVLDEDVVRQLTQPFRRLGDERTGSDVGVGLGLSIVAAIAETHEGRLEIHALEEGGLQVVVTFPLAVPALSGVPA